ILRRCRYPGFPKHHPGLYSGEPAFAVFGIKPRVSLRRTRGSPGSGVPFLISPPPPRRYAERHAALAPEIVRHPIRRTLPAVLFLAALAPARADEARPRFGAVRAVIVGISAYADKAITPRPKAEDDAKALHDLLTDKSRLGVPPGHMHLFL